MRIAAIASFCAVFCSIAIAQQKPNRYAWIESGKVEHQSGTATLSCNHPDTLQEVIRTLREEYGWSISTEMPPFFSSFDLVDDTSPKWRAAHPNRPGALHLAGKRFSSTFQESSNMSDSASEEAVLRKVVSDYNSSGNPGRFEVRKLADGVYDVIGTDVRDAQGADLALGALLDTKITLPVQERSLFDTVKLILNTLSITTGKKVIMMSFPNNTFLRSRVTVGGDHVVARDVLLEALQASTRPMVWDLAYAPGTQTYILSASITTKMITTRQGIRVPAAIDLNRSDASGFHGQQTTSQSGTAK
jgi:hypothetical protein